MAAALNARVRRRVLDADLRVPLTPESPVTVLFGPSGSGKTTLLRCVAGLDRPDSGSRVEFDGSPWTAPGTHLPTRRRKVGYLFQDHALFPHLSVAGNVGYGLHGLARRERADRVAEALSSAGAAHLRDTPTRRLSGGEAQRVALARALAPRPRLLLLDEPLSALDSPTRAKLRTELRAILLRLGIPTVVVTHDRVEALALGDRIVVLVGGRVHQMDSVEHVFSRPATAQAAAAVDVENVIPGHVRELSEGLARVLLGRHLVTAVGGHGLTPGDPVLACIRAEDIALETGPAGGHAASPRNHLPATVSAVAPDGPLQRVDLDAGVPLVAFVTRHARDDLELVPGRQVTAAIKAPAVHLIPRP
ncbi:molybdate transport system ATP-binding protein [Lipingzhangella halophila]|uniref:Molybdate transport system ATP-binding protein n=1 Tax=Lipingzhangella halophila TaxID=1783352 RepID=A0A7W7RCH9_9ACTN|nr:ABC transporter ATP-binding protein [Lipingzhangella halophila]MBB4929485.1 molybdate transport system ATP-binding protein [Lipingzhangella halophila]